MQFARVEGSVQGLAEEQVQGSVAEDQVALSRLDTRQLPSAEDRKSDRKAARSRAESGRCHTLYLQKAARSEGVGGKHPDYRPCDILRNSHPYTWDSWPNQ